MNKKLAFITFALLLAASLFTVGCIREVHKEGSLFEMQENETSEAANGANAGTENITENITVQELIDEQTQKGAQAGLGNLCRGEECRDYCQANPRECMEYCQKHPENILCLEHQHKGVNVMSAGIPGLCSFPEECRDYCEASEENQRECMEYCSRNPSNEFCNAFFYGGLERAPTLEIKSNFVDLDKVVAISKYRSCLGHVVVPADGSETKRAMKHYFKVKIEFIGTDDKVEIFAPFDAFIGELSYGERCREWHSEEGQKCSGSGEMWLYPIEAKEKVPPELMWGLNIIHIKFLPEFRVGDEVREGQLLGYGDFVGGEKYNTFDIVIAKKARESKTIDGWNCPYAELESVFNFMSGEVLKEYEKRGITKDNIIFSKEYRDNNECSYQPGKEPFFAAKFQSDPNQWVELT